MNKPTVGSLFAGIGGFDLGFERAGFDVRWQVEIDQFCRRVLAKHWPGVRRHDDVKNFPPGSVRLRDGGTSHAGEVGATEGARGADPGLGDYRVAVVCGGFPCQDISVAGRGAGIGGERSGLWREFARIVRVVRPRFVVVENVPALLARGMGRVLGDLAACGYDAEWDCLPAAAFGAPHIRDRVFVVGCRNRADAERVRVWLPGRGEVEGAAAGDEGACRQRERLRSDAEPVGQDVADSVGHRLERHLQARDCRPACFGIDARGSIARAGESGRGEQWRTEPGVGRVAHGVPNRVDRLRGLGNAVVPQVAEWIARRLRAVMEDSP